MRRQPDSIATRRLRPQSQLVLLLISSAMLLPTRQEARAQTTGAKAVEQGIAVEFQADPATKGHALRSGDDVRFQFRITDTAGGAPLRGLRPAAWIDLRRSGQSGDTRDCTRKAANFLGGNLFSAPSLDLNSWYVLAMNEDATISVVDPRFGFGGSQLLAMVFLDSPAEDWALTGDRQWLFVTMPDSARVAVVDATSWKISSRLEMPGRPARLALQPDEKSLWVAYTESPAGDSGVAIFDPKTLARLALISTGAGPHELAFSDDSRFAFVTNREAGTVSVIDTAERRKLATVRTGAHPSSIAFSPLARLAYVSHEGEGGIVAISGPRRAEVARMPAPPGIHQIRFAPGGRFGIALNPTNGQVHVLDASANRIVQTSVIHDGPDQVTFSSTLAYIRRRGTAEVLMIPLDQVGVPDAPLPLVDFPGGQIAFGKSSHPSPAASIVQVPGGNAVLVANPADHAVYYYQEGMAAPMGQFQNYGHEPRAVRIVDSGLQEGANGVYQTVGRVPRAGVYDVIFFLDSPRTMHCFELQAAAPLGQPATPRSVKVRGMGPETVRAGEPTRVRFQILEAGTREPIANLRDLLTLVFRQPGTWQTRQVAREISPGIYESDFTPPAAGLYYVYFDSPSLGLKFNSPHALIFTASDLPAAPSRGDGSNSK